MYYQYFTQHPSSQLFLSALPQLSLQRSFRVSPSSSSTPAGACACFEEEAMALVTMATPGCAPLHALPFTSHRLVPGTAVPVPTHSHKLSTSPQNIPQNVPHNVNPCRVRNEKSKVTAQTRGTAASAETVPETTVSMDNYASVAELKTALLGSLEGLNRGIFGVQNARKIEVERLLQLLEAATPAPRPTEHLDKVKGEWKLLYSTISILGSKRTKLGLRDFINLGDFVQIIDVDQEKAVNKVTFSVAGLGMLSGSFTIEASYKIVSPTRVDIKFENSTLVPEQLMTLFQKNYDLLLSIFNPEGWLEITYVDDTLRVGRDDKGNVFLLERI